MGTAFIHGHALVVGVGADVPNTVDDAIGLASILSDPERCVYPAWQVKRLTGPAAGRDAILKALVGGDKIVIDRAPTGSEQPPGATGNAYSTRPSGVLTHGEVERLRLELTGLQTNYNRVSKRIEAVDLEISRALDSLSKQIWEEKRAESAADRVSLVEAMRRIELQLNG